MTMIRSLVLFVVFSFVSIARAEPFVCENDYDCYIETYFPDFDARRDLSDSYREHSCRFFAAHSDDPFYADAYVGYACFDFPLVKKERKK